MGLIRKAASVSTLGGVKFTSRREAQTKEALAGARLARAQLKAQPTQWDEILAAFEAGEVTWEDLGRMQKLQMPVAYQIKCKAAQRRHADGA